MSRVASLPQPKQLPRAIPLPADDVLARAGISFERVNSQYASPVLLRQHGEGLGIFPLRADAAPVITRLAQADQRRAVR